jgi:WD40 repeat protein
MASAGRAAEEFAKVGIVECMAFSSDGTYLGVGTADGALTIYDWHSGRSLNVLR